MPAPLRLHNTLTRKVEEFVPLVPGKVSLYVCGMTVYDHCHVGHARAMVVFDAFVRYLRLRGYEVTFVRNFTDVDDKIIARANERGEDPNVLAQRYVDAFRADAAGLGLVAPDHEPRVTESMPEIIALIVTLIDKGHAYAQDGSVWFSVSSYDEYGKLSHQKVEELRSADEALGKRAPADFALWKAAKSGEPSWPSQWGPGRPGWHIECSAMANMHLGGTIDIHGGGLDLVFPHHENEIAQSECGIARPYVGTWMHNGLLTMTSGQKMGKSLGNVINVHSALEAFPAEALRLYYLHNHYRSPLPWSEDALPEALGMLSRLYDAREKAEAMAGDDEPDALAKELGPDAAAVLELGRAFPTKFHQAVDHDFNTAQGLAHLFELARAVNRFANHKKAKSRGRPIVEAALAAFILVRDAFGLMAMPTHAFHSEVKAKRLAALGLDRAHIEALLSERAAARTTKDWPRADTLRKELEQLRIEVLDLPTGVEWRVRLTAD
ncbi:MAG: cysteine--tRNA ligase [Myxococcales bacterium]|nr:cysteine--tRNA ligase [Myxococcales bacterium]